MDPDFIQVFRLCREFAEKSRDGRGKLRFALNLGVHHLQIAAETSELVRSLDAVSGSSSKKSLAFASKRAQDKGSLVALDNE